MPQLASTSLAMRPYCRCASSLSARPKFVTCANGVDDPAFEVEYAPYGVDSGLCVGVGTTAAQNTPVALEPCGVSSKTVWILDLNDSPSTMERKVLSEAFQEALEGWRLRSAVFLTFRFDPGFLDACFFQESANCHRR